MRVHARPMGTSVSRPAARVVGYPCLCVDDVERSVAFYAGLLDLAVGADLGWYVELGPEEGAGEGAGAEVVVALVARGHPSVPAGFDRVRGGVLVSVLVADAAGLARRAVAAGVQLAQP